MRQYTLGLTEKQHHQYACNIMYTTFILEFLLTFIAFTAHDLAPSIVKTDSKARAAWFNIATGSCIPVDASNTNSSSSAGETADCHFHLEHDKKLERFNRILMCIK